MVINIEFECTISRYRTVHITTDRSVEVVSLHDDSDVDGGFTVHRTSYPANFSSSQPPYGVFECESLEQASDLCAFLALWVLSEHGYDS